MSYKRSLSARLEKKYIYIYIYKCNYMQLLLPTGDHLWCTHPTHLSIIKEAAWLDWVTGRLPVGSTKVPSAGWWLAVCIQACTEAICTGCSGHSDPWQSRSRTTDHRYHQIHMAIGDGYWGLGEQGNWLWVSHTGRTLMGVRVGAE